MKTFTIKSIKTYTFLILIVCFSTVFALAQKNFLKRPKIQPVQTSVEITLNQQPNDNLILNEGALRKSSKSFTPVKIFEKPVPKRNGQDCLQGKVVLKVTFLSTGEIGRIWVLYGLGNGLTENSVDAAKKIKFEPATKDKKLISVTKMIQYPFTIY